MNVIVGCECSAAVRDAFRALGHNAWSCDLKPTAGDPKHHIQGDIFQVIYGHAGPKLRWNIGLFYPPCTFLCGSGMHWTTRGLRDPKLTVQAIEFTEKLWDSPIEKIGIENPIGCLSTRSKLGKPTQIIQPYHFGENASKKTCLWLKNLPPLVGTKFIEPRMVCECGATYEYARASKLGCSQCGGEPGIAKPRWSNQTDSGQNKLGPSESRAADRAKTYIGIAQAMAKQWGSL